MLICLWWNNQQFSQVSPARYSSMLVFCVQAFSKISQNGRVVGDCLSQKRICNKAISVDENKNLWSTQYVHPYNCIQRKQETLKCHSVHKHVNKDLKEREVCRKKIQKSFYNNNKKTVILVKKQTSREYTYVTIVHIYKVYKNTTR